MLRAAIPSRLQAQTAATRRVFSSSSRSDPLTFTSRACSYTRADACDSQSYARLLNHTPGERTPRTVVDLLLTDPPYCLLKPRSASSTATTRAERQPSTRKKLSWDASGAVQRFDSVKVYREFTHQWLSAAAPWLHPHAVVIIWTNFLGKKPICEAVQEVLPQYRKWNEMLWLKPSKPEGQKELKPVQHSILAAVSASQGLVKDDSSTRIHLSPSGYASLPPLSLVLTSPERTYRAYEVALVFGVGEWEQSSLARQNESGQQPPVQSVICPFETPNETAASSHLASSTHPNTKPSRVLLPLLSSYSSLNALVMDPFAGSSAHVLTAMRAGRRVAAMELNAHWSQQMQVQLQSRCECARRGEAATQDCMECIARP